MNLLKLIGALLAASALVVFGAQNTQSVSFHFLIWDTRAVPVVLALAIAVLVGVLLGWVVSVVGRFEGRRRRREQARRGEERERALRAEHIQDALPPNEPPVT